MRGNGRSACTQGERDQPPRPAQGLRRRQRRRDDGVGVYGLYERDAAGADARRRAGRRPAARDSPAFASVSSPTCTAAAGSPPRTFTRAVALLMSAAPDLVVLGGDYVTWGDPAFVGPGRRSAERALRAARRLRHPGQPRRAIHDMPAALSAEAVQMLKDARTTLTIHDEPLDARRSPLLDQAPVRRRRQSIRGATGTVVLLAHDPRRLHGGRHPQGAARAIRTHARRAGRAAGGSARRGAEVSRSSPGIGREGRVRRSSSAAESVRSTCRCGSTARPKSRC